MYSKRFHNQSSGVHITALEHCKKMKCKTNLHLTPTSKNLFTLSSFSDFVACRTILYIKNTGSISQVKVIMENCYSKFEHVSHIYKYNF